MVAIPDSEERYQDLISTGAECEFVAEAGAEGSRLSLNPLRIHFVFGREEDAMDRLEGLLGKELESGRVDDRHGSCAVVTVDSGGGQRATHAIAQRIQTAFPSRSAWQVPNIFVDKAHSRDALKEESTRHDVSVGTIPALTSVDWRTVRVNFLMGCSCVENFCLHGYGKMCAGARSHIDMLDDVAVCERGRETTLYVFWSESRPYEVYRDVRQFVEKSMGRSGMQMNMASPLESEKA